MKRGVFVALVAFALAGCSRPTGTGSIQPVALPPAHPMAGLMVATRPWPGRMPREMASDLRPIADAMVAAMNRDDVPAVLAARDRLVVGMGAYLGEPEELPVYGRPIDDSPPDRADVLTFWDTALARRGDQLPWIVAASAQQEGQAPPRLRETTRIARAQLQLAAGTVSDGAERVAMAREAANYLLAQQASNGVFGYPYDPRPSSGPRDEARRYVEAAAARGHNIVEKGWMIEDLGNGALNFDNAQAGLFLIQAWRLTGDRRYRDAAIRAGAWAMDRRLVGNFNYNGFNGQLLARLYRVTGHARYLERAKSIFELGVLPGQLPNGRWFDQHNAKIQYHAILMTQMMELHLALVEAGDPMMSITGEAIIRGLDNLSAEIITHGTSNAHEMLAVEALVGGIRIFGERPAWRRAINVDVNYLMRIFAAKLATRDMLPPETIAAYLFDVFGTGADRVDADWHAGALRDPGQG